MHYLAKLTNIIDDADTPYVYIMGDFNSKLQNQLYLVMNSLIFVIAILFVLLMQFYLLIALPL